MNNLDYNMFEEIIDSSQIKDDRSRSKEVLSSIPVSTEDNNFVMNNKINDCSNSNKNGANNLDCNMFDNDNNNIDNNDNDDNINDNYINNNDDYHNSSNNDTYPTLITNDDIQINTNLSRKRSIDIIIDDIDNNVEILNTIKNTYNNTNDLNGISTNADTQITNDVISTISNPSNSKFFKKKSIPIIQTSHESGTYI
jgi:hypothetical protein